MCSPTGGFTAKRGVSFFTVLFSFCDIFSFGSSELWLLRSFSFVGSFSFLAGALASSLVP